MSVAATSNESPVNYGTSKNVSEESVGEAGERARLKWNVDHFVTVPLDG